MSDEIEVPAELARVLAADPELEAAFAAVPPGRRRDLAVSVVGARRDDTRARRVDRIVGELRTALALRHVAEAVVMPLTIRIEGIDLPGRGCGPQEDFPGYRNIHVGVQRRERRDELLDLHPGDSPVARWTLACTARPATDVVDIAGPHIQGPPGDRFIYLDWGDVDAAGAFTMFRRAKLMLDAVPRATLDAAIGSGVLVGRLGLTDGRGNPLCARVEPPRIEWSAASA